jgi:hypothetical protein
MKVKTSYLVIFASLVWAAGSGCLFALWGYLEFFESRNWDGHSQFGVPMISALILWSLIFAATAFYISKRTKDK